MVIKLVKIPKGDERVFAKHWESTVLFPPSSKIPALASKTASRNSVPQNLNEKVIKKIKEEINKQGQRDEIISDKWKEEEGRRRELEKTRKKT